MNAHTQSGGFVRILKWLGVVLFIVLGLLLILGLLPMSSSGMASVPDPTASYAEAVARYAEIEQAEGDIVNSVSGSHLLVHDDATPRAYVLVHGVTNSPLQWLELGEMLYDRGHNVLILRMPYHGLQSGQVSELKALTGQDLRVYADQAMDVAAGLGDEVVVVGISGGGAVAAWMAVNRPEVDRALLLAPFFGVKGVPAFANTLLMNLFGRLPNLVAEKKSEPRHEWVYRGEASRGVAAFLMLGRELLREAGNGLAPDGDVSVITTAVDNTANNSATARLLDLWQQAGTTVVQFEFGPDRDIPHNSVDPAAESAKKQIVYDQMLRLLGE